MHELSRGDNLKLVLTIAFAMGIMTFEQGSIGYLLPFLQPDLLLTNTQVGAVASTYWVTFAIASYGMGLFADARGHIRNSLIVVLGAFGAFSILSGLVGGLFSLLAARAVMGLLAGALLTLAQAILGLSSSPDKVGANMGIATGLSGSLSGLIIAPLVLVQTASMLGWRTGYFIIAVPAWLAAYWIWRNLAEPVVERKDRMAAAGLLRDALAGLQEVLENRNILICGILCSLYIAYVGLGIVFLPRFLIVDRGFSTTQMSALIAVLGASSLIFSIVLPAVSDRLGRKRVLLVACSVGILVPLAVCFFQGPVLVLGALLFVGWAMAGTGSFFMGIIPAETVDGALLVRALGTVISLGVLLGGFLGPLIAGWSADRWGIEAPFAVQAACSVLAVVATLFLREPARANAAGNAPNISPSALPQPALHAETASKPIG